MRGSEHRILTTHAGSLPRPAALIEVNRAHERGDAETEAQLRASVEEVVIRQRDLRVDVPNDGEYGKVMRASVNFAAWSTYAFTRLEGLEVGQIERDKRPVRRSKPGHILLTSFVDRRDRTRFIDAYKDPGSGITVGDDHPLYPVCRGPISYRGQDAVKSDIENIKAALQAADVAEGFITAVGPGSLSRITNEYYDSDEEFMYACADAMREEYKAIIDAGLLLQIDDPCIAENWDSVNPEPSLADYRAFTMKRVEALNHALRGLPEDRIRFHLCWGSWHGPHTTDLPMSDLLDLMLTINAGAYSFEAGNVRHEHEWRVWQDVKLPDDKLILPGVVSHATNVVEHPELVAQRIVRFAELVGRERVVASTDCGLGGRVHPQIAWAKLEALASGAELATEWLWGGQRTERQWGGQRTQQEPIAAVEASR